MAALGVEISLQDVPRDMQSQPGIATEDGWVPLSFGGSTGGAVLDLPPGNRTGAADRQRLVDLGRVPSDSLRWSIAAINSSVGSGGIDSTEHQTELAPVALPLANGTDVGDAAARSHLRSHPTGLGIHPSIRAVRIDGVPPMAEIRLRVVSYNKHGPSVYSPVVIIRSASTVP